MKSDNESIFSILEDDFLDAAKKEFHLYRDKKNEYKRHLNTINGFLGLKKRKRFKDNKPPKFWSGRTKSPRIILVSLNPGDRKKHDSSRNTKDNEKDWKTYRKSLDELYKTSKDKKWQRSSPFYRTWYALFSGLYNKPELEYKTDKFRFLDKNVLNLNLFPFHSNQSNFPTFKGKKLALVIPYVINLLDFIAKTKPKDICIFNGKDWDKLLFTRALISNEIKDYNEKILIKKQKIKFFKYKSVKCVLFTKFLSSTGHEGLTHKKIKKNVANKIKRQYPTARWLAR